MLNTALIGTFLREATARERTQRVPEPDLVMDDPEKVAAFTRAGREDGVMAPVYLFHCAQICEVIRPGDRVVDLGCGPGTQLAMVARLNPDAHFLGIDLSAECSIARPAMSARSVFGTSNSRSATSRGWPRCRRRASTRSVRRSPFISCRMSSTSAVRPRRGGAS